MSKGQAARIKRLILILGLCGTALLTPWSTFSQRDDSFQLFWRKFKTAVIRRDRNAVARLSTFPIIVAEGVPKIQNSEELSRRFSDLFDRQTNAAQCFSTKEPTADTESPDRFTIVCPSERDIFVAYEFERTQKGWKFIHRLFPTACRCRGALILPPAQPSATPKVRKP